MRGVPLKPLKVTIYLEVSVRLALVGRHNIPGSERTSGTGKPSLGETGCSPGNIWGRGYDYSFPGYPSLEEFEGQTESRIHYELKV